MLVKNKAVEAIEKQQATVKPRSAQWMVGEQLKDICRREPASAELVAQDLGTTRYVHRRGGEENQGVRR